MIERGYEKAGQPPLWLITMTDMYILLMSVFLLLFAMGLADRPTEARTKERLQGSSGPNRVPAGPEQEEGLTIVPTAEGMTIVVGGEVAPFAEGSYQLLPVHLEELARVRRFLRGKMNVILVRGHTAGNWEDSVVLDGKDGRVRPFGPADHEKREQLGDHWLLSSLRANAIRAELCRQDAESPVNERRVRVEGDAFTAPVADANDDRIRGANRRVEIIVTSELVP